jgi:ABC-2 type transport system ATP-binding protein
MKSLFQLQNVTKRYRDITALDDISLEIQQGEILGFLGPNGAGKTTTIKILVGLIKNFHGSMRYYDQDTSDPEIFNRLHQGLGYLPQETDFQQWRTVKHALRTFGLLSGIPRDKIDQSITNSLNLVGLSDVINKKIAHLSGGMKQKLLFAQALMHNPKFLVLDEPMSGLDPSSRYHVKNIIKQFHQQGVTIFLSSHILEDIENLATRIVILHQGKIMKIGTPVDLSEEFRIGNDVKIVYKSDSSQIQVEELDCIQTITQESSLIQIIHNKPEISSDEIMNTILQYIADHHINVRNIMLQEPNLEDVYLHYVGGGKL